jgi:hypothetical protein
MATDNSYVDEESQPLMATDNSYVDEELTNEPKLLKVVTQEGDILQYKNLECGPK